jgi:hypothetical protein
VKTIISAVAAAFLGGCATPIAQTYPTHDTATVRTYVHNLGFKGLFASEGARSVSTRADMRRAEDQFEFSGFVMKHLAKARDGARIWRIDKNLLWDLDVAGKTYSECPLTGCVSPRQAPTSRPEQAPAQERPQQKPSCKMTLAKNSFSVKPTDQTRAINGFNTKEYLVSWDVVAQDKDKNKVVSTLTIEIWTTPEDDPRIKAVQAVDRRFEGALHAQKAEGMGKIVPADALKIIEMEFMNNFSADQRSSLMGAAKELGKIRGYPISTVLNWYLDGSACEAASQEKEASSSSGLDLTHGFGGLVGSATGMAAHKGIENQAKGMAGKPVFGFVEEVREMSVDPASDGLFVPPPDFKLVGRR